jgi:hypothetical protein
MTITSAAKLKFPQRLPQSSLRNFGSPGGVGIPDLAASFAFGSSYRWVRR